MKTPTRFAPRHPLLLALTVLLAGHLQLAVAAAPLPPVDALIRYESKSVTANGVTKEMHYAERMIRRAGHVWIEPVRSPLPLADRADTDEGSAQVHQHFDFQNAARHVSIDAAGKLQLDYIDAMRSSVVRVPSGEYQALGFDGDWNSTASLIAPASIQAMQPSKRPSGQAGARWYEAQRGQRFTRVLWSAGLQLALIVESGSSDGSHLRRSEVHLQPSRPTQRLPWQGLEKLQQHEYDDFLD